MIRITISVWRLTGRITGLGLGSRARRGPSAQEKKIILYV
jgi:hypothetical protein